MNPESHQASPTAKGAAAFCDYPMGPKLRAWLGIRTEDYRGFSSGTPTTAQQSDFAAWLADVFLDREIGTRAELTDIVEELVGMDLPASALRLARQYPELIDGGDFRTMFQLGNAAMLAGELSSAEQWFRDAQGLIPEEPAPYVNLGQIFLHEKRFVEGREWILAGLEAEPNNPTLWELIGALEQHENPESAGERLMALAEARQSWAGLSLASDLVDPGDQLAKLARLDPLYFSGLRDHDFLIELTAVMGAVGKYDSIPIVVWQAERLGTGALPWQLWLHLAQAHLAQNGYAACREALVKVRGSKELPHSVLGVLAELERECSENDGIPAETGTATATKSDKASPTLS